MAVNPKTFAKVSSVLGGCIAFPWLLWKTGNFGMSSGNITQVSATSGSHSGVNLLSRKLPRVENPRAERGNCEVEELSDDSSDFLKKQGQGNKFYIEVSCRNTNIDTSRGSLPTDWTGLFPSHLLANSDKLAIGKKFDINTETVSTEESTKTKFSGRGMAKEVEGKRGTGLKTGKGYSVMTFSITGEKGTTDIIYLIYY